MSSLSSHREAEQAAKQLAAAAIQQPSPPDLLCLLRLFRCYQQGYKCKPIAVQLLQFISGNAHGISEVYFTFPTSVQGSNTTS